MVGLAARSRKVFFINFWPFPFPVEGSCVAGCWNPGAAAWRLGVVPLPLQADDEGGQDRGCTSLAPGLWLLVD